MKTNLLALAALSLIALAARPALADVAGEYVEARSLSVHAGACHYNGEYDTAGREAVLVWKMDSGVLDGVRVDGLGIVAVVSGKDNLGKAGVARRAVLYVDQKATPAQSAALVKLVREKAAGALGNVIAVKTAPFTFESDGKITTVAAGNAARLSVSAYPCDHCVMPAEVWYKPLAPAGVTGAKVAQGTKTGYNDATLGVSWTQEPCDNVFVGAFAF